MQSVGSLKSCCTKRYVFKSRFRTVTTSRKTSRVSACAATAKANCNLGNVISALAMRNKMMVTYVLPSKGAAISSLSAMVAPNVLDAMILSKLCRLLDGTVRPWAVPALATR